MTTSFGLDRYRVERKPIPDNLIVLELPHLPPSTNNLYINVRGRGRVKSGKYVDWLNTAGLILNSQTKGRITGRVDILILVEDCHPQRDASNTIKPVEDLLVKCGVIQDDRAKFVRGCGARWDQTIRGVRIEITKVAA
jgi:Holliday junction resolvase RusA-like endonuclease